MSATRSSSSTQHLTSTQNRQKFAWKKANCSLIIENSTVCPFKWYNGYQCFYCKESFRDPCVLKTHTETHGTQLVNSEVSKLGEEVMVKVDITNLKCRLCESRIDNLTDLRNHLTNAHEKQFYDCSNGTLIPFFLRSNCFTCAVCSVKLDTFLMLHKHMDTHFSNFICETCGCGFKHRRTWIIHLETHEQGEFPCDKCDKIFASSRKRKNHVTYAHEGKLLHKCPKCTQTFRYYQLKQNHLIKVHGEAKIVCSHCEKCFTSRLSLRVHIRKDHLRERKLVCEFCDKGFYSKRDLDQHLIVKHNIGERSYACSLCSKTFAIEKTLKHHVRKMHAKV